MYTRCPECHTAFRVTVAQLKARDGLVRCGRCDSVFRADLHLFAAPAANTERDKPRTTKRRREKARPVATAAAESTETPIPVVSELSLFPSRPRWWQATLWLVLTLALIALLLGQFVYFYRNELAQLPAIRPVLVRGCALLRCELAPLAADTVPELLQTSIASHPRYANGLRIRATLVNRAETSQPLPLMQVSLTDSDGNLLARRTFAPREYLELGDSAAALGPNVVVQALLDVTNPDNKAVGYEVRLFPPPRGRGD
ncbi:MAG: DUF3426 domain-containing protein [Sulfurifustis sp.]